eukprot:8421788-Prorocentrum_lima.AAC.1
MASCRCTGSVGAMCRRNDLAQSPSLPRVVIANAVCSGSRRGLSTVSPASVVVSVSGSTIVTSM